MQAMVLHRIGQPLEFETLADPEPGPHEIRLRVGACGVCRTDLHVVDGELPDVRPRSFPGTKLSDASIMRC
jgi:alcohol dehydrogenase, propanol-preferring